MRERAGRHGVTVETDRREWTAWWGSRGGLAMVALWLLAVALATRQTVAVLGSPPERRLIDLAGWIGDHGVLRVRGSLYDTGAFSGTPFSALVLRPLTRTAEQGLGVGWTVGTLLLVVALGLLISRHIPGSARTRLLAAPVAISALALSVPVRNTFFLGQPSLLPALLVLLGALAGTASRSAGDTVTTRRPGALIGLAAALQPVLLLFAVLAWRTGRRTTALTSVAVFAGATAVAWAALPRDSWTYWTHHVAGIGLGAPADALANQSLHGLLLRLGLRGPAEIALFLVLASVVALCGLRRATRAYRAGQPLLAVAMTGCVAVAISPTAWQHQQLWILLACVGRVGRRRSDRWVWPLFVVLVMSLGSSALVPNMAVTRPVGENAPLVAALLTACLMPFLTPRSPTWDRPVATGPLDRPHLVLELLLIRVGYWAYSWVRSSAPEARDTAEEHGRQILALEEALRLDMEHWLNHGVASVAWLEHGMNTYYSTFHFLVPITLLAWLYGRRPADYRRARSALSLATLLGLVGFWLYPLAPPRLMPGLGYIDTAHGPQDLDHPDFGALTELSNQYAAMPSLHVGWSLWCGVVLWRLAPARWARVLGVLYPLLTTVVVMGTANHYLLDAVGGAVVVAAGMALRYAWERYGARAARPPETDATGRVPWARTPPAEESVPEGAGTPAVAGATRGPGAPRPSANAAAAVERAEPDPPG